MPGGFGSRYNGASVPPTFSGSGGFGSRFTEVTPQPLGRKEDDEKDDGGFWGGLKRNAIGRVYGIVPGLIQTEKALLTDIGNFSSGKTLGDLLHGDVNSETYSKVIRPTAQAEYTYWRHPIRGVQQGDIFTPGLDLLTVASLGLGRVGAAALSPTAARSAALRTGKIQGDLPNITVRATHEGPQNVVVRTLPRSGWRAGRMVLTDKALKKLPPSTPKIGEFARAGRADLRTTMRKTVLPEFASPELREWDKAYAKLTNDEKVAVRMIRRLPKHADLDAWKDMLRATGEPAARQTVDILDRPDFLKEYENPGSRVNKALDAYHGISERSQALLEARDAITPEQIQMGHFSHMMFIRGAKVLTKAAAYKRLRQINARINRLERNKGKIAKQSRYLGKGDIMLAQREGRRAALDLTRSQKKADMFMEEGFRVDELGDQARFIRSQVTDVMNGNLDTNSLAALGIHIPAETSSFEGVGAALTKAEFQKTLDELQEKRGRIDPALDNPNWRAEISDQINNLKAKRDRLHPKSQQPWRDRLSNEISTLNSRRKSLDMQALRKEGLDNQIARHQKDIADLEGGALVSRPFQDVRMQVLGQLHDMLGPAFNAYDKAVVAEHGMLREIEKSIAAAERKATSKKDLAAAREARIKLLQQQRLQLNDVITTQWIQHQLAEQVKAQRGKLTMPSQLKGLVEDPFASMRHELEQAGRPLPGFMPDQPAGQVPGAYSLPRGSISPPRPGGTVFDTAGELFRNGMTDLVGDVMTQRYMENIKWAFNYDLDKLAQSRARPVMGDVLPHGYEWKRVYRGQRMPVAGTHMGDHIVSNQNAFDLSEYREVTSADPNLPESEIAHDAQGRRLAVPKQYANQFRGEYKKSRNAATRVLQRYLTIWRHLILHLRIGWLENNIFGNTMLAGIRFAGPDGLKAFARMIAATKGGAALGRMLHMDVTKHSGLTSADIDELMAEQGRPGTFFGANLPATNPLTRAPGVVGKAARGVGKVGRHTVSLLPKADIWYEKWLRRGGINTILEGSPEVKAIYKSMPKESRNWREASRRALQENPEFRDMVSREVNDALGDFLSLTNKEREGVRQIVPFYAWFREITRIALKLPVDAPLRTNILLKIGEIGAQISPQEVPSQLQGSYPLGMDGDLQKVLALRGANPLTSLIDVGQTVSPLVTFNPGAFSLSRSAGVLNPGLASVAETLLYPDKALPLILQPTVGVAMETPQYRALFPRESDLYPTRTRRTSLADYLLGILNPKVYDPAEAQYQYEQGR